MEGFVFSALINLKVENDGKNETWRFGTFRADIQPDGRR